MMRSIFKLWLFLGATVVAAQESDPQLDALADRVVVAQQAGSSVVDLKKLEPVLGRLVELGFLSIVKQDKIALNVSSPDLSDIQLEEMLLQSQRISDLPYLNVDFSVFYSQAERTGGVSGRLERFHDVGAGSKIQQFREKFIISEPNLLNGFALLTIRPREAQLPDFVWNYSPLAKVHQELEASQREDVLFGMGFSLNDLLGFSARANSFEMQSEETVSAYVPMVSVDLAAESSLAKNVSGCFQITNTFSDSSLFKVSAVRRKLLKLSLLSSDPFSPVGRRVVYLDVQTLTPVFVESYDRADRLVRNIVAILKPQKIGTQIKLLPVATLLNGEIDQVRTVLTYKNYLFCEVRAALTPASEFDPQRLIPSKSESQSAE